MEKVEGKEIADIINNANKKEDYYGQKFIWEVMTYYYFHLKI